MSSGRNRGSSPDELESCTYKQLQKLAKSSGIRANAKAEVLRSLLREKALASTLEKSRTTTAADANRKGLVPTASTERLDKLPRRELQILAKENGIRANLKSSIIVQELLKRGVSNAATLNEDMVVQRSNSPVRQERKEALLRERAEKWSLQKKRARKEKLAKIETSTHEKFRGRILAPRALRKEMLEKRIATTELELPSPVRKALGPMNFNIAKAHQQSKKHKEKLRIHEEDTDLFRDASLIRTGKWMPAPEAPAGPQRKQKDYGIKSLRPERFQGKRETYMSIVSSRRIAALEARRNMPRT